jgi:hypothetical protein
VLAVTVDVTDDGAGRTALGHLATGLGPVDVLHFNPSTFRAADPLTLTVPELLADVALGVGALLTALQALRPSMRPGARVTATGSMVADEPLEWRALARRPEGRSAEPGEKHRRCPGGAGDQGGRSYRPWHAEPGGSLHSGPG